MGLCWGDLSETQLLKWKGQKSINSLQVALKPAPVCALVHLKVQRLLESGGRRLEQSLTYLDYRSLWMTGWG